MTATLPRPHVEAGETPDAPHRAVIARWHELRRVAGLIAVALAVVSGLFLSWPAMVIVGVVGAASAVDASLALRSHRTRVTPTLIADITFTGIALVVVAVPVVLDMLEIVLVVVAVPVLLVVMVVFVVLVVPVNLVQLAAMLVLVALVVLVLLSVLLVSVVLAALGHLARDDLRP